MNPPVLPKNPLPHRTENKMDISVEDDLKSVVKRTIPPINITGEILLTKFIEKKPPLIDPIFPQVGIVAVGGSSDTGKSCFLNQLAMAIVSGENEFLGFPINPVHKNVIYVSTEDDPQAIAIRLEAQNINQHQPRKLAGLRYWFDSENLIEILDNGLKEQKADCVIIDAFSDIFGDSDINQVGKVRGVLNAYKKLANVHKCLFIFLHHTGKRTDDGAPSKHDLLGSQGFEAKMRAVLLLRKDRHDESVRHLVVAKGNYLPPEIKNKPYILKFKDLVFTNTGNRINREDLAQDRSKTWHLEAISLNEQGKSLREIGEILLANGHKKCSKSTIENFFKLRSKSDNNSDKNIILKEEQCLPIEKGQPVNEDNESDQTSDLSELVGLLNESYNENYNQGE